MTEKKLTDKISNNDLKFIVVGFFCIAIGMIIAFFLIQPQPTPAANECKYLAVDCLDEKLPVGSVIDFRDIIDICCVNEQPQLTPAADDTEWQEMLYCGRDIYESGKCTATSGHIMFGEHPDLGTVVDCKHFCNCIQIETPSNCLELLEEQLPQPQQLRQDYRNKINAIRKNCVKDTIQCGADLCSCLIDEEQPLKIKIEEPIEIGNTTGNAYIDGREFELIIIIGRNPESKPNGCDVNG